MTAFIQCKSIIFTSLKGEWFKNGRWERRSKRNCTLSLVQRRRRWLRMSSPPIRPDFEKKDDIFELPKYKVTPSGDALRPVTDPRYRGSLPLAVEIDRFLNHPVTEVATAGLVMMSCTIFALETIEVAPWLDHMLIYLEKLISILFFVEYCLRMYSKDLQIRYAFTKLMVIDFIAILPLIFYQFGAFAEFDFQYVRLLRVARVFRLQRILDKSEFFNIFGNVPPSRLKTTEILLTVFSLIYLSAGLYYDAECVLNPEVRNFFDAVYFSLGLLTTVGFGPSPVTPAGQAVTLGTVVIGALVVPFQIGALARTTLGEMMTDGEKEALDAENEQNGTSTTNVPSPYFTDVECSRCTLRVHQTDAKFCRNCGAPLPTDVSQS